ncbi:MAG: outer membrane beta-barrel protein [Pseudomonadota bacterium]
MKRLPVILGLGGCMTLVVLCLVICVSGSAEAQGWRFPIGLTGVTGYGDVVDLYEENLEAAGYTTEESWNVPVGISFNPYYEFGSGFRIGTGFGPMSYLMTSGTSDDVYFFDVPVNANIGFTFFPDASIAPYVRAGVMYHLAAGEYVEDVSPGFFAGVGIEFMRNRKVALGLEVAVDFSEIDFEKYSRNSSQMTIESIKPYDVMISIFAAF